MGKYSVEQLSRHVKTHSARSVDDSNAVHYLESLLRSDGKINTEFATHDTWPNIDGSFELVSAPDYSRRPKQRFIAQIKGTSNYTITKEGTIKYQLQSLAFPAYIAMEITLDPGILFVVLDSNKRGKERTFWKYISPYFLSSVNFSNDSTTIEFTNDDEIEYTDESVNTFAEKLVSISESHSFMKQLDIREYRYEDISRVIFSRCQSISMAIDYGAISNQSRDNISKNVLTYLSDLCQSTLVLNGLIYSQPIGLRAAWEIASLDINTKFLSTFLQGLSYIGLRVPEDGQHERLMLKYYDFLWKIRKYLYDFHHFDVLQNLEKFPREINEEDEEYNKLVAASIKTVTTSHNPWRKSRYYIQKKNTFYVGSERYFEITLQLAGKFATKFNRITVYSKIDISSNYSIQVGFEEVDLTLWDSPSKIKVVTNWRVSIEPSALNKLAQIIGHNTKISARFNEYEALMRFLTQTGISLLDFIDMHPNRFSEWMNKIYTDQKTAYYEDVLFVLHKRFNNKSKEFGRHTIRFILLRMKEEVIENLLPERGEKSFSNKTLCLSPKCSTFELNPAIYNLPHQKTNNQSLSRDVSRSVGSAYLDKYLPYIRIRHLINQTGELYFAKDVVENPWKNQTVDQYNALLNDWDRRQGVSLKEENGYIYIDGYVQTTIYILQKLFELTQRGNDGQAPLNRQFVKSFVDTSIDQAKKVALENAFVNSRVITIYGAAGTGKTTLMNYLSSLMDGRSKLFLTKTHTALENLKRRIDSPGRSSIFSGIDKVARSADPIDFDLVFIDECSTIDNRTFMQILQKLSPDSLLILAGDIYQIESIDFGNWFFYAKDILPQTSIVELTSNWRTQEESIISLWDEVRFKRPLITEKLVIDGPFSESISKNVFAIHDDDEVVLCLNYDGKFGLNSMNSYFQDANPSPPFFWQEWRYKVGDPILFNESKRFPKLYNNLKGKIVDIDQGDDFIRFTVDIDVLLTALDSRHSNFEWISATDNATRIRFTIYDNDMSSTDEQRELERMNSIVPFQLAYAVSIHKAQGLEYSSVKVVIPNSNSERISHGIFYTAITRTKDKLKIYWSADTMKKIISSFHTTESDTRSLEFIKRKLQESIDD